jgi:ABC-type glycerol-3-phosphate transport system permease component
VSAGGREGGWGRRRRFGQTAAYALLVLGSAVYLLPFLWMVSGSLKQYETVFEFPPSLLPKQVKTVRLHDQVLKLATYSPPAGKPVRVAVLKADDKLVTMEVLAGPQSGQTVKAPRTTVKYVTVIAPRWQNYPEAWTTMPFNRFLLNTLIITVLGIVGQLFSASFVAYSFARLRWPGRNVIFVLVLATLMLPTQVTLIPQYVIYQRLGWIDTFLPLVVPAYLGGSAVYIFLLRQFFLTIPVELEEAARIDGASSFAIFSRIMLPLSKPILATVAVFSFVALWNDFMGPLIYLNSTRHLTLAVGLRVFQGTYGTYMHLLMAVATVALIPVIVIFFVAQKQFVRSIVLTGIKG